MVAEIEAMHANMRAGSSLPALPPSVSAALGKVERHRLLPAEQAGAAYRNIPLPIGQGQTISQPYIVALSTALAAPEPHHRMLEVGTGSGYQAAVLAELTAKVYSIEIIDALGQKAGRDLGLLGYRNIEIRIGDGYKGWPEQAPFDAIVVTAAAPRVPDALVSQLKSGGRLVIPVGPDGETQWLLLVTKLAGGAIEQKKILPVRFVPMVPGR
ncbi:MAG: protein-L-isoaspartate(D-aspartate) O-methyltransferase [Candidatus Parcubacteria bacterium]|nr:protein-L-isoaspartate(D-aspartate) O-methyltransferase [Burkholderiales bacterium]